jgi:hypothetical protein
VNQEKFGMTDASTTKVFFTYVWGPPGDPAWPLTFSSKAARSHARATLAEGDIVFTVCTKIEPTRPEHQGKVVGAYKVSDLEVNTQDYDVPHNGITRFPFALHPIAVWQITSTNSLFAKIVGPLTPNHHLQAQSKLVELDPLSAKILLALDREEVSPALPKSEFGKGIVALKNSKLAPKHEGSFVGAFGIHAVWFVYTLVLRDSRNKPLALKVGYSNAPDDRELAYNISMATEVTGLHWKLDLKQPTSSEDAARQLEQDVLRHYDRHKLGSNCEILANIDPLDVVKTIADLMRA